MYLLHSFTFFGMMRGFVGHEFGRMNDFYFEQSIKELGRRGKVLTKHEEEQSICN